VPYQRLLPALAVVLALGMTVAAAWTVSRSPRLVDEIEPTPVATPPTPAPTPIIVPIEEGEGVRAIAEALEDAGVIDSAIQFRVLVELMGYDRVLQAGEYEFDPGTPELAVIYRLRQGLVSPLFVTVVEGWRLEEIADALDEEGVIAREEFLEAALAGEFADEFAFLRRVGPLTSLEGYLYPATYFYGRDDTAADVIRQMLEAMDENFSEGLRDAASAQGLTMHGVLTLASIIEREARVAEERPIMAQVFLTRLRRGILLEADPTVQYAVAEDPESVAEFGFWKAELTLDDLEVDSDYNTYRERGLPPAPIAAPRLDSIEAVIEPADTNYLYFVARPDGTHAFAETLEQHQANIEEFLP
jgi:UPF0755 protein